MRGGGSETPNQHLPRRGVARHCLKRMDQETVAKAHGRGRGGDDPKDLVINGQRPLLGHEQGYGERERRVSVVSLSLSVLSDFKN